MMSHDIKRQDSHQNNIVKDAVVRARVSSALKHKVEDVLERLGLTMTEAIALYLSQIELHNGIPFKIKIPNEETAKAIKNAQEGKNLVYCKDGKDMFKKLGVKCSKQSTKKSSKKI